MLALPSGDGLVHEDLEDPRLERRSALEAVQALEHRQPGLLGDLLGHRPAGHVDHGQPHHRRLMLLDQARERLLVAGPQGGELVEVVGHGRTDVAGRVGAGHHPTISEGPNEV